ncbi:MAG: universal stress protein [Actinomycetota bacterium]
MERIVVGVDGSEPSHRALHWALVEARLRGARLDVVHTWHMPYATASPYSPPTAWDPQLFEDEGRALLDAAVANADTSAVEVHRLLSAGAAAPTLIETAKGADLLVVGSRGRGGFAGLLLGSVSQQVVHHAPCPVVVIPPTD